MRMLPGEILLIFLQAAFQPVSRLLFFAGINRYFAHSQHFYYNIYFSLLQAKSSICRPFLPGFRLFLPSLPVFPAFCRLLSLQSAL